ncbi:HTH-type transcriptional activator RhaS [compost metagenome]
MSHLAHNNANAPRVIVFLGYPDMGLLHVVTPLTAFWLAGRLMIDAGFEGYDLMTATPSGGLVRTAEGIAINTTAFSELKSNIDTLIIPGRYHGGKLFSGCDALVAQIPSVSKRARRIAATSGAADLLVRAGVVPTEPYNFCNSSIPSCLDDNGMRAGISLLEENIWVSDGTCPDMDMALALIAQDCGRAIALKVSQQIQVFVNRSDEQSDIGDFRYLHPHKWGRFERMRAWLDDNLHRDDLNIEAMAARMAMSPRNLFREFKAQFGRTPTAIVTMLRVNKARQLLGDRKIAMINVAQKCGFGSVRKMRTIFQSKLKMSPKEYRRLFSE